MWQLRPPQGQPPRDPTPPWTQCSGAGRSGWWRGIGHSAGLRGVAGRAPKGCLVGAGGVLPVRGLRPGPAAADGAEGLSRAGSRGLCLCFGSASLGRVAPQPCGCRFVEASIFVLIVRVWEGPLLCVWAGGGVLCWQPRWCVIQAAANVRMSFRGAAGGGPGALSLPLPGGSAAFLPFFSSIPAVATRVAGTLAAACRAAACCAVAASAVYVPLVPFSLGLRRRGTPCPSSPTSRWSEHVGGGGRKKACNILSLL